MTAGLRPAVADGPTTHRHGDWRIENDACPWLVLWRVEIAEEDWDYDRFSRAVVWAHDAEEAERIVRAEPRYTPEQLKELHPSNADALWIESPEWRLEVTPAPTSGIALVHWHAG